MSDEIERLLVRVEANAVQFENQMKRVNRALHGSAAEVRKTRQQFKREMDQLGRDVYVPVQAASALALGAIVGFSYQAAKRAEAVAGAFEQTFRDMPAQAKAAASAIADEFGRAETDIKDNFTQLRSVLVALGVDAEQSLAMVDTLQRRALDIGAFRDVSDADAFRAVISGITGETEPLKRFGIVVNETAVKAELLRLGFKGNATQASESAKAVARSNIILRQSAEMHGQVAREADTLAEKEKRARAEFVKAAEDLGQRFLPIAADLLEWAVDALDAFNDLPDGVQNAGLALLAFVAASGPIAAGIKGLQALIAAAVAARGALAAVGGSGGAASAGRTALTSGAAGAAGAVAPLAVGATVVGVGTASFAPAPPRPDAPVEERLAYARRYQTRSTRLIQNLEREKREQDQRRATLSAGIDSLLGTGSAQAGGAQGDFGLSEAQKLGAGGGGGGSGGRRGGAGSGAADRVAEARSALDLELAIATARATGDEAAVKAAEERETLSRLVKDYADAGSTDAQAEATAHLALLNQATALAEERERAEEEVDKILAGRERQLERESEYQRLMNDQLMDQLGLASELARLAGDEGSLRVLERELWVQERINRLLELKLSLNVADAEARAQDEYAQLRAADITGGQNRFGNAEDAIAAREDQLAELADLEQRGLLNYQQIMERRAEIDAEYWQRRLTGEGTMLDGIAALSNSSIRELAAIGKAAAIAQATIDGYGAIQKAWASAPFPANLPAVAITTAATASNIAAIAGVGFERGGYTGNIGTKDVAGVVHGQEYVFDAAATRRIGVSNLEAMRRGSAMLGRVSQAAASIPGRGGGGDPFTFAPTIHAPGADMGAVRRIERALEDQARSLKGNVKSIMAEQQRFKLGTRRP